uniref:Uncharacterized protein LOC102803805 n=1 Tax=Saccoglossus kowalevskii TaxID=10224 RepID=A0ABM0M9Q5_SACKO|nr:PREDICTED: uncharacterized protein LOC102803805 [Saccoglossus kowalevskii]
MFRDVNISPSPRRLDRSYLVKIKKWIQSDTKSHARVSLEEEFIKYQENISPIKCNKLGPFLKSLFMEKYWDTEYVNTDFTSNKEAIHSDNQQKYIKCHSLTLPDGFPDRLAIDSEHHSSAAGIEDSEAIKYCDSQQNGSEQPPSSAGKTDYKLKSSSHCRVVSDSGNEPSSAAGIEDSVIDVNTCNQATEYCDSQPHGSDHPLSSPGKADDKLKSSSHGRVVSDSGNQPSSAADIEDSVIDVNTCNEATEYCDSQPHGSNHPLSSPGKADDKLKSSSHGRVVSDSGNQPSSAAGIKDSVIDVNTCNQTTEYCDSQPHGSDHPLSSPGKADDKLKSSSHGRVFIQGVKRKCCFLDLYGEHLIVSDTGNNVVYVTDLSGKLLNQFGHKGIGFGEFNGPTGVTVDTCGNILVADNRNDRIQSIQGVKRKCCFLDLYEEHLIVSDTGNNVVYVTDLSGKIVNQFGHKGIGFGEFNGPTDVTVDTCGNILVADNRNDRIQVLTFSQKIPDSLARVVQKYEMLKKNNRQSRKKDMDAANEKTDMESHDIVDDTSREFVPMVHIDGADDTTAADLEVIVRNFVFDSEFHFFQSGEIGVTLKNSLPNLKTRTSSDQSGLEEKMSQLILSIDDKLAWEEIPSEDEEVNSDEKIETQNIDKNEKFTIDEMACVRCEEINEMTGVQPEEINEMTNIQCEQIDDMTDVRCEEIAEMADVQCEEINEIADVQCEEIAMEEIHSKESEIGELELVSKPTSESIDVLEKKSKSETALSVRSDKSKSKSKMKRPLTFKYSSKTALFAADLKTKRSLELIDQDKKVVRNTSSRGSTCSNELTQLKEDSISGRRPLSYHCMENASTVSLVSLTSMDSRGRRSLARLPISSQITAKILNQSEESIIPSLKTNESVTSFSKYSQRSAENVKVGTKDSFVWTPNPFYEDDDSDITDYIYMADALQYYRHFIQIEKLDKKERRKKKRRQIESELLQQKQELEDMIKEAREKYSVYPGNFKGIDGTENAGDDTKQVSVGTKDKRQDRDDIKQNYIPTGNTRQDRDYTKKAYVGNRNTEPNRNYTEQAYVRSQLEALPEFTPVFIYTITVIQIILFIILCALGGLAPIELQPSTTYMENIKTFVGTETIEGKTLPNLWIGPSAQYWIGAGVWKNEKCCEREAGENSVAHILKPCCIGLTGQCVLVTHEHCTFHQGVYHTDEDHCNQINCLQDVCNFGGFNLKSSSGKCNIRFSGYKG